jgi:hypothetical protein
MAKESKESKAEGEKLDPVSLSTWARLRSAGKIAKPHEAENMGQDPRRKSRSKTKRSRKGS